MAPPGVKSIPEESPWLQGWDGLVPRDGNSLSQNKLLMVARELSARLARLAFPLHRCKRSNRVFTQRQHLALLVLRQLLGKSYREFCAIIELCTPVLRAVGLRRVPHFTTLQKFAARVDQQLLDALLASFSDVIRGRLQLAVDSTGFACSSASHYFIAVLQRNEAKAIRTAPRSVRRHMKQTLAVDTRTQLILAARYRYGPTADAPDGIPILEAASRAGKVGSVVADKGYDSGAIRQYIWYRLKAKAHIPLRVNAEGETRRSSIYDRKQRAEFRESKYRRRALIETVHSVEKRVMRGDVLARSTPCQNKELLLRAVAYDLRRVVALAYDFY